jgi:F-box/leucine-rich repeat protein 2/20
MGLGCVAVGCPDLREVALNWCLGITDLGVRFLALKCKKLASLNLSYTMVSAPAILSS